MVCVNDSQPMMRYLQKSQPEMSGSLGERGGLDMMSRSGGLKPRAVAGKPSVTRLTHSNWTGIRASGIPKAAVRKILRHREKNTMLKILMLQTKSSHFNGNLCNWESALRVHGTGKKYEKGGKIIFVFFETGSIFFF